MPCALPELPLYTAVEIFVQRQSFVHKHYHSALAKELLSCQFCWKISVSLARHL